jgi:hypothetical protein
MEGLVEYGSTRLYGSRDESILKVLQVIQDRYVALPEFQ